MPEDYLRVVAQCLAIRRGDARVAPLPPRITVSNNTKCTAFVVRSLEFQHLPPAGSERWGEGHFDGEE